MDMRIFLISTRKINCMDGAAEGLLVMPFDLLREITNDFFEERKLDSGSFGKVYKGVHQDGVKIVVKMLYDMPGLDDELFQNEFKNLTRLRHQKIVRLVGYCHDIQVVQVMHEGKLVLAEKTHRALCLEYMSNGSLDKYLSDECDRYDWHTCYGIIKGICQDLKYLQNELKSPIYHLGLKPVNVLLDENMVPRIADFGMSRLFGDEQTQSTKSSLGTIGYLPPEYIYYNLISNKFDIFSMGVIIMKIMAGRAGYFNSADMSSEEFTNVVQESWTNRLLETSNLRRAYSEQVKICIEVGDLLPGIEGFQVVGNPIPGSTLRACGFSINGTTHCNFQWVHYLEDGTRQSIEGATMYDYVVTADDVGAVLVVECTPMDDHGRQGHLLIELANSKQKITCGQ
ncbi:Cysteine-rich receptor-like protein kinase 26 [Hordeum vulgare]|nr:Cysteine-rich receptor-like protein kinase 26 [Hordeum vulgare]